MHYRPISAHETAAVCHLAAHVFSALVAPLFEPEGVAEFLRYLAPNELALRLQHGHEVWVAEQARKIIGMLDVRNGDHIDLLFVDQAYHGQGIGRRLVETVIDALHTRNPLLSAVSVHATPNAVSFYTRLGFYPIGSLHLERGMRFLPMVLDLAKPP